MDDSWVDSLPSDSIMVAIQLVKGGPLLPSSKGPHTSDMVEFVMFDRLPARLNREDDDDAKTQTSSRTEGIKKREKKARGAASEGNEPVMVICACPANDKMLGSTRKEAGEKSRTVMALGRLMFYTEMLFAP